jgi:hypothetical protein
MEYVFIGTAKEIEERGVKLNGKFLDKASISALSRHGIIDSVGKKDKQPGQRGRVSAIFGLKNRDGVVFTFAQN